MTFSTKGTTDRPTQVCCEPALTLFLTALILLSPQPRRHLRKNDQLFPLYGWQARSGGNESIWLKVNFVSHCENFNPGLSPLLSFCCFVSRDARGAWWLVWKIKKKKKRSSHTISRWYLHEQSFKYIYIVLKGPEFFVNLKDKFYAKCDCDRGE